MEKDKFQPIVMPCTKEQYESLIPVLEKNEIDIARNNDNCPYSKRITNCFAIYNNFVSRTYVPDSIFETDRPEVKIYKRFNRKIFLKSLGIVEEPEFVLPEKWCVVLTNDNINILNEWGRSYFEKITGWGNIHMSHYFVCSLKEMIATTQHHKDSYTEITFEQFKKYVLKQDISILESQSVTNKQTKMKSTVNEIKQSKPTIKKGLLVVTQERVGIVTKYISDNNFDVTILHPSGHHGLIVTSLNYANIRIFKGKLTLEQ